MLEVKNLSAFYKIGSQKQYIFKDISFTIEQNSFTALCGMNGSGKSTLLSLLDGIIPLGILIDGEILLNGQNIFELKRKNIAQNISYLIQTENPAWNFTGFQYLETAFYSLEGLTKLQRTQKIKDALQKFDILHLEQKRVFQISGGEFQKCRLARSFVQNTDILLLDEPVENLDAPFQKKLLSILKELSLTKTILFSIHDLNLASIFADNFILFTNNSIIQGCTEKIFTKEVLSNAYQAEVKIYNHPELHKKQVLFL